MPIVIGLIGEIAAGKETFSKMLALRYYGPIEVVHTGNFLREELRHWGLRDTRENLQELAITMNNSFGEGTLARAMQSKIVASSADVVVYDSVRWLADVDIVSAMSQKLFVYITAPEDVRWQRAKARKEKAGEEYKSFRAFQRDEDAETEVRIRSFGASIADVRIDNGGSEEEFEMKVIDFYTTHLLPLVRMCYR